MKYTFGIETGREAHPKGGGVEGRDASGGSKGVPGRDTDPLWSKFFRFHAVFGQSFAK